MLSRACLPHLLKSAEAGRNPHILTLCPPFNFTKRWMAAHPAYTVAKYAMTITMLGLSAEFEEQGVAANCLWPKTIIGTDAVKNLYGGDDAVSKSRRPEIMADAAYEIFTSNSRECTGNTFLDEDLLRSAGVSDFSKYSFSGNEADLELDIYVDPS